MRRNLGKIVFGRFLMAVVGLLALGGSFYLMQSGLNQLAEVRQMERLPETPIAALAEGPYALSGKVGHELGSITTQYSRTQAVYYRYLLEEEYRDSEGNRRTRTVASGERGGRFLLRDATGAVAIHPGYDLSSVDWSIERSYRSRSGSRIYSEWALKPGDSVRVVGQYDPVNQQVGFTGLADFSLPALVSGRTLDVDGGDRLFRAALWISIAAGLLALGVALLLITVKIHRFWVYVVIMSLAVTGTLGALGIAKLNAEWSAIATLYESRYEHLGSQQHNPLVLADVVALQQLIQRSTDGWLDRRMYRQLVEKRLPVPEVSGETAAMAQEIVERQPRSSYQNLRLSWGLAGGGGLLGLLLIYSAIRTVKFKRLVESVPTSSTQGLSFGLSELKGLVEVDEAFPAVGAPLKHEKCVAYDYKVEERRGSGKNQRWVTIEHNTEQVPFWLEDENGRALIYPEGAEIEYPKHYAEIKGRLRYSVRWLDTLVNVYCLGFTGLDRAQPDRLAMQKDEGSPFIISTRTEEEIILSRGARGFIGTAVSLGLFLFAATVMLAADGNFSPDNLLLSALTVPVVLSIYIAILHYNDLVFLKNRVNRARANIDTILQQRHDLWPSLQRVVKAAMGHEKKLLQAITRLRGVDLSRQHSPQEVDKLIRYEQRVKQAVQARVEQYPDLKADKVIKQFMDTMTETENYLALLRNSYTDSAMIYNTRIQSLPDLILAKLFRFRSVPQFSSAG